MKAGVKYLLNDKCPLCNSNKYMAVKGYKQIGPSQYKSRLVYCCFCGHYFLNFISSFDLNKLYNEGAYKIIDTRGSIYDKVISFDDKSILRQLHKLKIKEKTLLDFGCGKGQFIYRASKYGWKVKGIETARNRAEFGKNKYGLDIRTSEYRSGLVNDTPFNVITLFHVLEHLPRPKELLKELLDNNLVQDGYLVIEVPLFKSLQSKIAGKRWIHLDPPLHISHFTKSSLLKLLRELNYNPIKYEYFSIHLGILGMVQSIMSLFGYKKMIISELKFKKSKRLIISILLVLPFAFILEFLATICRKGGIIRVYCKKKVLSKKKIRSRCQ